MSFEPSEHEIGPAVSHFGSKMKNTTFQERFASSKSPPSHLRLRRESIRHPCFPAVEVPARPLAGRPADPA
jgi:hypothetical protein